MTYDNILNLVKVDYVTDDLGVEVETKTSTPILCNKKSVGSKAFYSGKIDASKETYIFTIHNFEYDTQQQVEFDGKQYTVIRTFEVDFETLELTVQEAVGIV